MNRGPTKLGGKRFKDRPRDLAIKWTPKTGQAIHRRACDWHCRAHARIILRYSAIIHREKLALAQRFSRGDMEVIYQRCKREGMIPIDDAHISTLPQRVLHWPKCHRLVKDHGANWRNLKLTLEALSWLELIALADHLEIVAAAETGKRYTHSEQRLEHHWPVGPQEYTFEQACIDKAKREGELPE